MQTPHHPGDRPLGGLGDSQLNLILRDIAWVPVCPSVALCLVQAVQSASPDDQADAIEQATRLVESDPALAANLLRAACRQGVPPPRIARQAVARLGLTGLRRLAMAMQVLPPLDASADRSDSAPSATDGGLDRPAMRRHSLAVGIASESIARLLGLPLEPGAAHLCGLLHDLGKLALDLCMPKSYARAMAAAADHDASIASCEREVFGVDHATAGRRLGELWKLPEPLVNVLWLHHQPPAAIPAIIDERRLVAAVALADALARSGPIGSAGNCAALGPEEVASLAGELGLTAGQVDGISAGLAEQVEQRLAALCPGDPGPQGDLAESVAAAQRELARLCEPPASQPDHARAFRSLADLAAAITPQTCLPDALAEIAKAFASAHGLQPSRARPVVAYAIGPSGAVLAACCTGQDPPAYRTATAPHLADSRLAGPCPPPGPAAQALDSVLGDSGVFSDWMDMSACRHQPLPCAGHWIGGLLYSQAGPQADSLPDAQTQQGLAAALGLSLGVVLDHDKAIRLSEQLADASRLIAHTQEALAEAKTLTTVAELAAGAAHELNTPLAIVSGRAQLMARQAAGEAERTTWLLIAEQAQRISDIITALMEYASPPPPNRQAVAVPALLEQAAAAFSSCEHPKSALARVDIRAEAGLPSLKADPAQLQSVLVELMRNAATAAVSDPRMTLSAETDGCNGVVRICVADDGPGMDSQTLARAFLPFFSAHAAGRRRGLGLALARRYVENNGGRIWIRSRPNQGTAVFLEFPPA